METSELLPRITVPDEGDRATVAAALVAYWHEVACAARKGPDLVGAVSEGKIIMALLQGLIEETQTEIDALMDKGIASLIDGEMPDAA